MKFFTVSLFVLLSSAILGGSFASPSHKGLGGLVGDVLGTVGNVVHGAVDTVGNVVGGVGSTVHEVVNNLSDVLHEVLKRLPKLADDVRSVVTELGKTTGKALHFAVHDVVDGVLNFVAEVLGCSITISLNEETLEICINDHIIGTILNNGSVVDLQNNLIGMCDREDGVVVFVGGAVDEVLHLVGCVGESLGNLLHSLDVIVGDIIDNVKEALANISEVLHHTLADLPTATADILEKLIEELHKTGEGLVCAAEKLIDNNILFKDVSGETLLSLNLETLEVTVAGHTIGLINQDGSIVDSDGNVIGCLIEGLLIFVGETVKTIPGLLHNVLGGLLNALG